MELIYINTFSLSTSNNDKLTNYTLAFRFKLWLTYLFTLQYLVYAYSQAPSYQSPYVGGECQEIYALIKGTSVVEFEFQTIFSTLLVSL